MTQLEILERISVLDSQVEDLEMEIESTDHASDTILLEHDQLMAQRFGLENKLNKEQIQNEIKAGGKLSEKAYATLKIWAILESVSVEPS